MSYLEETVVRALGDVVCLRDVVHQSPEVFDCVKSSHLKIMEMVMMILKIMEMIMMIRASQAYYSNTELEAQSRYFITIRFRFSIIY